EVSAGLRQDDGRGAGVVAGTVVVAVGGREGGQLVAGAVVDGGVPGGVVRLVGDVEGGNKRRPLLPGEAPVVRLGGVGQAAAAVAAVQPGAGRVLRQRL